MIRTGYVICYLTNWIKAILSLAVSNNGSVSCMAFITAIAAEATELWVVTDNTFGIRKIVLSLVIITVFINAVFGILKNLKTERLLFARAQKYEYNSKQYLTLLHRSKRHKFQIKRLYFVFFKCLSLVGYLYFVRQLLQGSDTDSAPFVIQALDVSTEILTKAPVAIFWYYEFKSIGENSASYFGKKAPIFVIAEKIFEPRIFKFFGTNTPTDGDLSRGGDFEENNNENLE